MQQPDIRELAEKTIGFVMRSGLKVVDLGPRHVKVSMPLSGNENHVGSMYAGALFTLAELPGGALCLSTFDPARFYSVVKEMNIKFLRPAKSDVTFELNMSEDEEARVRREGESLGKSDFVLEGELIDAKGRVVGTSRGLYHMRLVGS